MAVVLGTTRRSDRLWITGPAAGHRLGRGLLGPDRGENLGQGLACGRGLVEQVELVVRLINIATRVEGDVGVVGVAAASHPDVEVLTGHPRSSDDVRGVDGAGLSTVRGDRVTELDVLRDVLRWQPQRA